LASGKSAGSSESSSTLDTSSKRTAVPEALTHTYVSTTPALEKYRFPIGTRRSPIRRHPDNPRLIHTIQEMSGCSILIGLARRYRHHRWGTTHERRRLREPGKSSLTPIGRLRGQRRLCFFLKTSSPHKISGDISQPRDNSNSIVSLAVSLSLSRWVRYMSMKVRRCR
jgi:hypothetical protein